MKRRSRAGFTLMELVVAIGITGTVAALGYSAFSSLVDARTAVRAATFDTERATALREMLYEWLSTGRVATQYGPQLDPSSGNDQLVLRTVALTPALELTTLMRLFIDDDPATPERGLTMQFSRGSDDLTWVNPATRELEPLVGGLRVEFLDARTKRWYQAREAATIMPIAVRVTLKGTRDVPLPPVLQLPLITRYSSDAVGGS